MNGNKINFQSIKCGWKGDAAGYCAKHKAIYRALGQPSKCQHCGTTKAKRFEWANISKKYKRALPESGVLRVVGEMKEKSNKQLVLEMLSDGRIHFSAEFRDRLGLLEYRKRISELNAEGHNIKSMKIVDEQTGFKRPAYQMEIYKTDLFGYEAA